MSKVEEGVPILAPPDFHPRVPAVRLPPNSCDTHAHVFGPAAKYEYYNKRIYTPSDAPIDRYLELLGTLGVSRAVLVQPSPYGKDNSALIDAISGRENFRGVAVVDDDVSDAELERLHAAGVRGLRFNIVDTSEDKGVLPVRRLASIGDRIAPFGWHIELLAHVNEFPELESALSRLPVPVSFGHLGYVPTGEGIENAGFQALMRLMRDGNGWAKLTAPYRISPLDMPFADVAQFAHALLAAAPDRVVWGTDWPHAKALWPIPMPNTGDLTDLLLAWIPDADLRRRVLVDNPAKLYGFPG
jgi:predicted TIM-barrel fold metal-dependent hydrolase